MARRLEIKAGEVYGRLTVIREVSVRASGKQRQRYFECRCECGEVGEYRLYSLRNGGTRSCGCLARELAIERGLSSTGGASIHGGGGTLEHSVWLGMKARCTNREHHSWRSYGGRGITVCARWLRSFPAFLEDMGRCPSVEHLIDRIDVNGSYEPRNCRWSTALEQAKSRRNMVYIEHNGERILLVEMVESLSKQLEGDLFTGAVERRLRSGDPVVAATRPLRGTFIEFEGRTVSLSDLCVRFFQCPVAVEKRLKRGMSLQESLTHSDDRSDPFFRVALPDRDKRWYLQYERRILEKRRRFAIWLESAVGNPEE